MALELSDASIEGDPAVRGGEQAEGAFAADIRRLNRVAISQNREQGKHESDYQHRGQPGDGPVAHCSPLAT